MNKIELLAPAGNLDKLNTALYFGADAVYCGGKAFSLRSFADNFTAEDFKQGVTIAHSMGKKIYVTINIFARNYDFEHLKDYLKMLEEIKVDGVILSDPGIIDFTKNHAPNLEIHISTQANTLNKYSAQFWANQGAKRIVLARELSLKEISQIREALPDDIELEAFCHGAMCISYSGRCLLSDYFTNRSSNRGACVQACRWNYSIREKDSNGDFYDISEDERGTYILNSKDLNMISHIDDLHKAGVTSFKIEGRMKSQYYVATVVNAYRRAIDEYYRIGSDYKNNPIFAQEILKTNHRSFTTAYMFADNNQTVNYLNSQSNGDRTFIASVLEYDNQAKSAIIEMRNRFMVGDELEVLSPSDQLNKIIKVENLTNLDNVPVTDAKIVQEKLILKTDIPLYKGDILRK